MDVEWEGDLQDALVSCLQEERDAETKAKAGKARQRYLTNLAQDQESGDRDEDDAACILCKCEFTRGYVTQWHVHTSNTSVSLPHSGNPS